MYKKTQLTLIALFLVSANLIFGQKLLKKAEMQFENGDYAGAVSNLQRYLSQHDDEYTVKVFYADALTQTGQITEAIDILESIPEQIFIDPMVYRKHGDLLKKVGSFQEAITVYKKYGIYRPLEAEHCIKSCIYAIEEMSGEAKYEMFVLPTNSNVTDFGITFYKNLPVFSSFRNDILMNEEERLSNVSATAHKSFLYNKQKNRLGFLKNADGNINHVGPISFANNGMTCAYIESQMVDGYSLMTTNKSATLFIAKVNEKGEITSSKPYTYNEVGASINSAHVAFDGTAIYFSSDRKGGYGGFDIYVTYYQNDQWTLPKNLGPTINTPGNDVTPFLQGGDLYFASDYHMGIGGFDIFKSTVQSGEWLVPTNLGLGINSIGDDVFPAVNSLGEMYVTSNRLGGKGNFDIYKGRKIEPKVAEDMVSIPAAVSLDALVEQTQRKEDNIGYKAVAVNESVQIKTISANADNDSDLIKDQEEMPKAFKLPEFDVFRVGKDIDKGGDSFEGAHRIGLDELLPDTEVFFIQLASVSAVKPNFARFKPLVRYGNIYKMLNDRTIKVRLGYFTDRKEAEEILQKVKSSGYKDAFITYEHLNTAKMELILSSTDNDFFTDEGNFNSKHPEGEAPNFASSSRYKVRLASYEDPIWFDVNKVKDLGRIEQWTKGGWTIFILAGYNNLEEAKKAMIQASNRGFKTAEVVIDNGGILERLKQN